MSRNVYVFAEQRDGNIQKVAYELVGKARELADTFCLLYTSDAADD